MIAKIARHFERFFSEDNGNSATEYAIMLALIVLVSIGAISALGDKIAVVFQQFEDI
jgi:Flp pilus assembly pilin Flp